MVIGGLPRVECSMSPDIGIRRSSEELAYARAHFFLPHRYCDSFHTDTMSTESFVTYDDYDLLMVETRDPFGNTVT